MESIGTLLTSVMVEDIIKKTTSLTILLSYQDQKLSRYC